MCHFTTKSLFDADRVGATNNDLTHPSDQVIVYIRVRDLWIYTGIIIADPDLWQHSIGIWTNLNYLIFISC